MYNVYSVSVVFILRRIQIIVENRQCQYLRAVKVTFSAETRTLKLPGLCAFLQFCSGQKVIVPIVRECLEHCAQVADKFQMELLQVQGSNRLITKLLQQEKPCTELVFIQPGEEITMTHFASIMGGMRR